ncbi:retrovirus-related pol polyprotein from transposon TNT 1-94, partial [Tanacetum coccineum]
RAENQNLLDTISELKARMKNGENGKSVNTKFLLELQVVQIVLWVVDSGCSKHMTGDRSLLRNFVEKFMGTVRFGNDNVAPKGLWRLFMSKNSPSTSSIIVETHEAPPVVTTSDEQTSPISLQESDEFNQEDSTNFDGNTQFVPYDSLNHEEIESSTTNLEPSNVQNFHQVQPSTHIWTKDHPIDQVIGDPSKPILSCKDDCKSTSGGLQFLGGKLVSWSSKKQDCTAMSTAEAEYVSLSA